MTATKLGRDAKKALVPNNARLFFAFTRDGFPSTA